MFCGRNVGGWSRTLYWFIFYYGEAGAAMGEGLGSGTAGCCHGHGRRGATRVVLEDDRHGEGAMAMARPTFNALVKTVSPTVLSRRPNSTRSQYQRRFDRRASARYSVSLALTGGGSVGLESSQMNRGRSLASRIAASGSCISCKGMLPSWMSIKLRAPHKFYRGIFPYLYADGSRTTSDYLNLTPMAECRI